MSTTYPTTRQTFTNPTGANTLNSPDHAGQHADANDTLLALQDVLGTTSGTSVLKDFSAGQFPVRVNSGGTIVQTLTGGTINNTVIGTSQITGGTVNNAVLGTPTITLGSDATGDIFFRSSGGTVTRLGIGSNGQVLTTNGTTPSWGTASSGGATINLYTASGTTGAQQITATTPSTAVALQGLSQSVTVGATTKLSLSTNVSWYNNVVGGAIYLQFREGTSTVGQTVLQGGGSLPASTWFVTTNQLLLPAPTNGTNTYSVYAYTNTGTLVVNTSLSVLNIISYS